MVCSTVVLHTDVLFQDQYMPRHALVLLIPQERMDAFDAMREELIARRYMFDEKQSSRVLN